MGFFYVQRCKSPRLLGKGEHLLFCFQQRYIVYGEVRDGKLENLSFVGEDGEGERGLVDGLLELCQGKNRGQVEGISLREVESFLREQNHLRAFSPKDEEHLTPWFVMKDHLLEVFSPLSQVIEKNPLEERAFAQLSLLKKIRLVSSVLHERVRPMLRRDGGDVELLDVRGQADIVLSYCGRCAECPMAPKGTLEFIRKILEEQFQESQMNVMLEG